MDRLDGFDVVVRAAGTFLCARQHADGGWGYRPGNRQSFVEPTAWAVLALSGAGAGEPSDHPAEGAVEGAVARAVAFLLRARNGDGGWPNAPGMPSDMMTARVVLALAGRRGCAAAVAGGRDWIVRNRLADGGWGWCQGTTGFLEPAAYAALALSGDPRLAAIGLRGHVLALRCADGGWCCHVPEKIGIAQSSQVSVTPLGVLALSRLRETLEPDTELTRSRDLVAGWVTAGQVRTAYSLAMALWCLLDADAAGSAVASARTLAVDTIGADGAWNANIWHTAMMVHAARGAATYRSAVVRGR